MTLSEKDVEDIAKGILTERVETLKNEVRHCILLSGETSKISAPFSALLYCFSSIDLLGSLYTGKFDERSDTENAKLYMRDLMCYSDLSIALIQKIFRHKLVHTAEPKWFYKHDDDTYIWSCYSNNRTQHLECQVLDSRARANNFSISIWSLAEDIVNSVQKDNGYLNKLLKKEGDLFEKFSRVFDKISFL